MGHIFAKPLSTNDIRAYAMQVRNFLKLNVRERVNAPKLLDVLSEFWKEYGFQYLVLQDNDERFDKNEEAKTDITTGIIYIKESVINEACRHKYRRASFTICHEIGHFILHRMLGGVNLSRSTSCRSPKIYEDPEWQADTFASEFMMPAEAARNMTVEEIRKTYCVSRKCAMVRYEKMKGEFIEDDVKKYFEN